MNKEQILEIIETRISAAKESGNSTEVSFLKLLSDTFMPKEVKQVDGSYYCPICNHKLYGKDHYCPECGQAITSHSDGSPHDSVDNSVTREISLWTDGSCKGNGEYGGYGYYYEVENKPISAYEGSGYRFNTTNNKMELTAVIEGLKSILIYFEGEKILVKIHTDSTYIANAFNKGWLVNWVKNDWKKADKKPVLNQEYWKELMSLLEQVEYEFVWVKGHDTNEHNNYCDELAQRAAETAKEIAELRGR